jgi:hypothetical protein
VDIRKFILGLDLGQAADFTALIGIERVTEAKPHTYHMRIAQRYPLRTPYTTIVERMAAFVQEPPLAGQCTLVVDATGVGQPVVDMFRAAKLACPFSPVTITGGNAVTRDGNQFNVPKRDLATATKVLLDDKRLRISEALPDCRLLVTELENFRVKITTKANDTYESWREGLHDDLVLATALACWLAERGGKQMFEDLASAPPPEPGPRPLTVQEIDEAIEQARNKPWTWNDVKYGRYPQ